MNFCVNECWRYVAWSAAFPVQQEMGSFMKKGKPEDVVAQIPGAELDKSFRGGQPTGHTVDAGTR